MASSVEPCLTSSSASCSDAVRSPGIASMCCRNSASISITTSSPLSIRITDSTAKITAEVLSISGAGSGNGGGSDHAMTFSYSAVPSTVPGT